MSFLTGLYAFLFYFATVVLLTGLIRKVVQYARTPAPLKIPTTPAPTTTGGVVLRMAREVVLFESLFRGTKWTWIFGWVFHFGLFLVTLRHLRYFIDPVWLPIQMIQPFGVYGGIAMVLGPGRALGASFPGGSRALHHRAVRSPHPRPPDPDRGQWAHDVFRRPYGRRGRQRFLPRPDGFPSAPVASRPSVAAPFAVGRGADDRLSVQQAPARSGPVLQSDAQSGGQSARDSGTSRPGPSASSRSKPPPAPALRHSLKRFDHGKG